MDWSLIANASFGRSGINPKDVKKLTQNNLIEMCKRTIGKIEDHMGKCQISSKTYWKSLTKN